VPSPQRHGGRVAPLEFRRWTDGVPEGVNVSLLLGEGASDTGIYVLRFVDGAAYVGQATSLRQRIPDHRRRWDDIVALEFAPCGHEELDECERRTIVAVQAEGCSLRNIQFVENTSGLMPIDRHLLIEDGPAWLKARCGPPDWCNAARIDRTAPTNTHRKQFEKLLAHRHSDEIFELILEWFDLCLRSARATEQTLWTVNAYPSTGRRSDWQRLVAVTVNNVETVVIGEATVDDESFTVGFFNMSIDTPLTGGLDEWVEENQYRTVGPVLRAYFDSLEEARELLEETAVKLGVAGLTEALILKGKSMMRFHNPLLADEIMKRLCESLAPS
jgi:hypothetical protein